MKKIVIGILAHVDAGKTTLSEGILYTGKMIRRLGRVDNRDAFLDTYEMERQRGITIFSKQAVITMPETEITLIDTPGHTDFSAEMERTLCVLDYAVLVISGADGIQSHTLTLWKLLEQYNIPTFIFVNKMDQNGTDRDNILFLLHKKFSEGCIPFDGEEDEAFYDAIAMTGESTMDEYLDTGSVGDESVMAAIKERKVFPCYFGSALKCQGIDKLLAGLDRFSTDAVLPECGKEFSGRVFKIQRDENNLRQTFLKVTGGTLKVRDEINGEKINQIRIYNGSKYTVVNEADRGTVCAVTGPAKTYAGQGLGLEKSVLIPVMEPVLSYRIILPDNIDPVNVLPKFRSLEEEIPELHLDWNEECRAVNVRIMGAIQIEILKNIIKDRLGIEVEFGSGNIIYKETIGNTVEGVGHFEPLKHYAEVHLLMEPLDEGSGLEFAVDCKEDELDRNWQRLILTHLEEKSHRGVLTGSEITDMRITLASGRAHTKHTEGGDFRQATYRAVRQGLMQAENILLEPMYQFELEVPIEHMGRAMTDIKRMYGRFDTPVMTKENAIITGVAPVVTMREYAEEVMAYTGGRGSLRCVLKGFEPCHNAEEVIEDTAYDAEGDTANPSASVFCAHGAGFVVPWNEVPEYMHLESCFAKNYADGELLSDEWAGGRDDAGTDGRMLRFSDEDYALGTEEVDLIIDSAGGANKSRNNRKWSYSKKNRMETGSTVNGQLLSRPAKPHNAPKYILVDGYNVIFAWNELAELAKSNIDSARDGLLDMLCNYQAIKKEELIVVFDAYRVKGHSVEYMDYHNIHIVYTAEAETADRYIERFAHENGRKYDITVVTSDGQEQIIVIGQGCSLCSSREFEKEVRELSKSHMENYIANKENSKVYMSEILQKNIDNLTFECNNSDIADN